jgi:hypothetical protein
MCLLHDKVDGMLSAMNERPAPPVPYTNYSADKQPGKFLEEGDHVVVLVNNLGEMDSETRDKDD